MNLESNFLEITPVLPSQNIMRDIEWHQKHTGFNPIFGDNMYSGLQRAHMHIHLQWHAETPEDPLLGGSVIKLFVGDIKPVFDEFVERRTVSIDKLRMNTAWGTHEFGFFDLNHNAIFIVQSI